MKGDTDLMKDNVRNENQRNSEQEVTPKVTLNNNQKNSKKTPSNLRGTHTEVPNGNPDDLE